MNPQEPASLAVLAHKVNSMHEDFKEMRAVLQDLTAAINKLALVEERQSQFAAAQDRAFDALKSHGERIRALEIRAPGGDRVAMWLDRGTWALVALFFTYLAKQAGLL